MNKKIIVVSLVFTIVIIMTNPVMAIGPQNAKNNKQTVYPTDFSVQLITPNGIFHEWMQEPVGPLKIDRKDASDFNIGNSIDGTDLTLPDDLFLYQNKWIYLTQTEYYALLVGLGVPAWYAAIVVIPFTEGVYYKTNFVSK